MRSPIKPVIPTHSRYRISPRITEHFGKSLWVTKSSRDPKRTLRKAHAPLTSVTGVF